jgi:hypothetical protein
VGRGGGGVVETYRALECLPVYKPKAAHYDQEDADNDRHVIYKISKEHHKQTNG